MKLVKLTLKNNNIFKRIDQLNFFLVKINTRPFQWPLVVVENKAACCLLLVLMESSRTQSGWHVFPLFPRGWTKNLILEVLPYERTPRVLIIAFKQVGNLLDWDGSISKTYTWDVGSIEKLMTFLFVCLLFFF